MGAYGMWVYIFGASQVLLRDEQGTTRTIASLHASAWALGLVIMSFFNARVTAALGRGKALRVGTLIMCLGALLYTSGLPTAVTLFATVIVAIGGALVIAGVSAFISVQQGLAAPASLSEANAIGAFLGLIGAFSVGLGVMLTLGWRPAVWLLVVYLVILELVRGRNVVEYNIGEIAHQAGRVRDLPPIFWWTAVTMLPAAGVEYCVALWSADLLEDRGHLGSGAAAAALACFGAGLTLGRVLGSRLAERVNPERLLAGAFAVACVGLLVLWTTSNPALMMSLLFIIGLGVALHWPLAIGRSIRCAPDLSDRASGTAILAAGLALMVTPFALGAMADAWGLRTAFLVVPVLAALGVALVLFRPVPVLSMDQPVTS
jgi:predicted MFS family arabinose efflux permease